MIPLKYALVSQALKQTILQNPAGTLKFDIVDGKPYQLIAVSVQTLKIDRSFIMFMDKHADHASIVKAIVDLAHNLGLKVVARSIENEEVLARLTRLGCDEDQGYFIGKPMPEKDFSIWLECWEGQSEIDIDIGDDLVFAVNPLDTLPKR